MRTRPLIEFKLNSEDVTLEQLIHLYTLIHERNEILLEQEGTNNIVLVLDHMLNDD